MAEELEPVKIPIEFDVDPSSLGAIDAAAAKATQSIEALTAARKKLNEMMEAGTAATVKRGKTPPRTAEEQEVVYQKQRDQRQARQESNDRASTEDQRFQQYARQQRQYQERAHFAQKFYGNQPGAAGSYGRGGIGNAITVGNLTALAGGNAGPIMSSFTQALMRTISTPSASSLGGGSAAGLLGSGAGAAGSSGLLGAAGDALGGLSVPLAALGGYLFYNSAASEFKANTRTLAANAGGQYSPSQTLSDLIGGGGNYQQMPGTTYAVAQQLGLAGVQGNEINANAQNTMALATMAGRKPEDLAGLTAALSVGGRQSATDITRSYAELVDASKGSKISLDALIDSLKVLSTTTGGLGLDYKAVAQIAAGQQSLPTGINLGAVMSPTMGAQGFNLITAASVLGISPDKLLGEQGALPGTKAQPALVMQQLSSAVQRTFGKKLSGTNIGAAEGYVQSTGLLNLTGLSDSQAATLVQSLASGNIATAMTAAGKGPKPSAGGFLTHAQRVAAETTSAVDQAAIKAAQLKALGGGLAASPTPPSPLSGGTPALTGPINTGGMNGAIVAAALGIDQKLSGIGKGNFLGTWGNSLFGTGGQQQAPAPPQEIHVTFSGTMTGPNGAKATVTPQTVTINPSRTPKGPPTHVGRATTPKG